MSDPIRDCPHGHMKGKCDTCELIEAEQTVTDNTAVIQTLEDKVLELAGENMTMEARIAELEAENARLRGVLTRIRDCDWVISLPDRMDAVRDIAKSALLGGGE